jgi:hypothetical protein
VTLTVGDLARHLPVLRYFLRVQRRNNRTPDRGVDSLAVTESTPEEYGWLLRRLTGRSALSAHAARAGILPPPDWSVSLPRTPGRRWWC